MRKRMRRVVTFCPAIGTAGPRYAQTPITDAIPPLIEKRGLMVEIRDVARLPETRGLRPADQDVRPAGWARVSFVRDLPEIFLTSRQDGMIRMLVPDSGGEGTSARK